MEFNGAVIKADDLDIALAVVGKDFMNYSQAEKMENMRMYAKTFGNLPFVVLIDREDGSGESDFFGRPDLIARLKDIPLNCVTFKVFKTKED